LNLSRWAGFSGILGSVLPLAIVLSATYLSSWFSWSANALSELGVGEQAVLFNSAMLLGGALYFLFAVGLYKWVPAERRVRTGVLCIMGSSVCLALVGVFTIDYFVMHGIVAAGFFLLAPAGLLLIGFGSKEAVIKRLSLACGIGALLAILVFPVVILALPFSVGFAVPELAESLIISVWTIFVSTKLLQQR